MCISVFKSGSFKKLCCFTIFLFIGLFGFGVPYQGDEIFTYFQPDGSSFQVQLFGDEYFAYQQTLDGYVVVEDPATGFFCYARLNSDASELISTGLPVVQKSKSGDLFRQQLDPHIQPYIRLNNQAFAAKVVENHLKYSVDLANDPNFLLFKTRSNASQSSREDIPGSITGLTILVDFPDNEATIQQSAVENFFNQPGYTQFGNACSVRDYFLLQSDSLVDYSNIVAAYVRMPKPKSYYDDGSENNWGSSKASELIITALQLLVDRGFDFTKVTTDNYFGKNYIRALNVLYAGSCSSPWNKGLWPHKWSIPATQVDAENSIWASAYQLSHLRDQLSIGTICHESGHLLFGFPDLYSYIQTDISLGQYSLMSHGSHADNGRHPTNIDPFLRIQAGWTQAIEISSLPDTLEFTSKGREIYRYTNPFDTTEYFLIEFRNNDHLEGPWGGSFRSVNPTSGLCLYHAFERGSNTYSSISNVANVDFSYPYKLLLLESTPDINDPLWFLSPSPTISDGWRKNYGPDIIHSNSHPSLNFWSTTGRDIEALINFSEVTDYSSEKMSCIVNGLGFGITANAFAGGSIHPNGTTKVAYRKDISYSVTADSSHVVSDVLVDGVSIGTPSTYTFKNVTEAHTIQAFFQSKIFAVNTYASNGGLIIPSGSTSVVYNDTLGVSVRPDEGYQIDSVLLNDVNIGTPDTLTLYGITSDHFIEAYFSVQTFQITGVATDGGVITPADTAIYSYHQTQVYHVEPHVGYRIDSVWVDSVNQGNISSYTFADIESDHQINAYFSRQSYTVITSHNPGGAVHPADTIAVWYNDSLSVVITPDEGYKIDSILLDGQSIALNDTIVLTNIADDYFVEAYFSPIVYFIQSLATEGGTIYPDGLFELAYHGQTDIIIQADTGYQIDSVLIDGVNMGITDTLYLTRVEANHTVEAFFSPLQFIIITSASAGGEIIPVGESFFYYGDDRQFDIIATNGYKIDSVLVDSVNVGAVTSFSFVNIIDNHHVDAYFSRINYQIVATHNSGGTITPVDISNVFYGDTLHFKITADKGFRIDSVLIDGSSIGSVEQFTFAGIISSHTISAYFSLIKYNVATYNNSGGSIIPSGSFYFDEGVTQGFKIKSTEGYNISNVLLDKQSLGSVDTLTLTDISNNHTIEAVFVADTVNILSSANEGGFIYPEGELQIAYNDTISYSITPMDGFHIEQLLVDGLDQGSLSNYTFAGVKANHSIVAVFMSDSLAVEAIASNGGSVSPAGIVNVAYENDIQFWFTPDEGYHISRILIDGQAVNNVSHYRFENVVSNHRIEVEFSVDTFQLSASSTKGGAVSPVSDTIIGYGQSVAFNFIPDTGFLIAKVIVDGIDKGALPEYNFSRVTANHHLDVIFVPDTVIITASACHGGTVHPSGEIKVPYGSNQQFIMTPDAGFSTYKLRVDKQKTDSLTSYTFIGVTENHKLRVSFTPDTFNILTTASNGGYILPEGNTRVFYGDTLLFYFVPDTGYLIGEVLVDGYPVMPSELYRFDFIRSNHTLHVNFVPDTLEILSFASHGGQISPLGVQSVLYGGDLTYSIHPDEGHFIADVLVDGISAGVLSVFSFSNVTANHTIDAKFAPDTFMITAVARKGGSVSPQGISKVPFGSELMVSIIPDEGYVIKHILVDGEPVDMVSEYVFTNVQSDHTIEVSFILNSFIITAAAETGGQISPNGSRRLGYGQQIEYKITPDDAYAIADVLVDGISKGAISNYTFTNLSDNHRIRAVFIKKFFTLTVRSSEGGNVNPSGTVTVEGGNSHALTITPDTGYFVSRILLNGDELNDTSYVIFENILENLLVYVEFAQTTHVSNQYVFPLSVYPNPNNGNFIVRIPQQKLASSVLTIVSVDGKLVRKIDIENHPGFVNVNELPIGHYILQVTANQAIYQSQVLILP